MKGLRFEWIGHRHYSVVLHVGDSFVPVEDDALKYLLKEYEAPSEKFLEHLIERVGTNDYLKEKIRREAEEGDPRIQVTDMKEFLVKHKT